MIAAAPTASTIQPAASSRRRRPLGALVAIALLVGFIANTGASIYLGPYPVSVTYFTVTGPADPQSGYSVPIEWTVPASTRAEAISALNGRPYLSLSGPAVTTYPEPRSWDQSGDSLRIGLLAALLAFVALYLLGLSARFRPIEARLGDVGAAFGRALGATKRGKAGSLLLVGAGALAGLLVALALGWALTTALNDLLETVSDWRASLVGFLVPLDVAAVASVAVVSVLVRRRWISSRVGAFLVGFGGLFVAAWVMYVSNIGASCLSNAQATDTGPVSPPACVADIAARIVADPSVAAILALISLFFAIPAVGSILVYRDYRRRQAAPSERPFTHAIA